MSKMDALRAMREAKYAAAQTRTAASPRTAPAPVAPPAGPATPKPAKRSAAKSEPAAAVSTEACGHRNISGRSCTRPQGHSEKNHRYS